VFFDRVLIVEVYWPSELSCGCTDSA